MKPYNINMKESVLKDYEDGKLNCMKCGEMWNVYDRSLFYDVELNDYICTDCYFWLLIKITNRVSISVTKQYNETKEYEDERKDVKGE